MNSTHDNGGNARLDEDLDKLGRAYRQLEAEEPPELLDLAIRNSARRAVGKQPRRMKFGWLHGLTTAAVFVLALSVVIHQRENQPAAGNGVRYDRPQPPPAASPAKAQSRVNLSGEAQNETEEAAGAAKDLALPAPAAPASEPLDQTLDETLRENRQKISAEALQRTAAADTDGQQMASRKSAEKKESDKPALTNLADEAEDAGADQPVVISATPPAEPAFMADTDMQAERQLQSIIDMKRNGDENWKAALKTFTEKYPGYPLPDELKD